MARVSIAIGSLIVLLALPAWAGQVNYADGKGKWASTLCQSPKPPATLVADPNIPADDLNARMASHNTFVAEAQAYMDCVSKEAQRDAEAMGQMIVRSAQGMMDKTQADVSRSAQLVGQAAPAQP